MLAARVVMCETCVGCGEVLAETEARRLGRRACVRKRGPKVLVWKTDCMGSGVMFSKFSLLNPVWIAGKLLVEVY